MAVRHPELLESEGDDAPAKVVALFLERCGPHLRPMDHLWIAILAATLRVLHLIVATGNELFRGLFLDAQLYAEAARSIRAGAGAAPGPYLLSPLYPYFLALFPSMDGPAATNPAYSVRAVQCLLGVGTCVLTARIAGRISGRVAGLVAGVVAALYGPLVHADAMIMLAGPLAFCLTAGVAAAVEAECSGQRRWWPPAGLALGAAAALRPSALPIGLMLILVLGWRALRGVSGEAGAAAGRSRSAALWLAPLLVALGLAAPILPFAQHNRAAGAGAIALSAGGGFNFWVGNHEGSSGIFGPPQGYDLARDPLGIELAQRQSGRPELDAAQASSWWFERAREDIANDPMGWFERLGRKLGLYFHPQEIPQLGEGFAWHRERSWALLALIDARWLLLLAIFAPWTRELFRRDQTGRGRALGHAFGSFVLYTLATCLFFVAGRFRLPIMPIVIALATITVVEWIHSESIRRLWVMSFFFVFGATSVSLYRPDGPFAMRITGTVEERHLGLQLMESGRYGEAIEVFSASLREEEDASTRINLGRALRANGQSGEALLEYQRVLGASPQNALAKFDLGLLLWEDRHDSASAIDCFRAAVRIAPSFSEAWFNLGQVLMAAGELSEAREVLERALVESSTEVSWRAEAERALIQCVDELAKREKDE